MKRLLLSVVALLGWISIALAGPNAGGTIFLHDPELNYCIYDSSLCGQGTPPSTCQTADVRLDGADYANPKIFKVYAAFPEQSQPRLKAMAFGVHYPSPSIVLVAYGACIGDLNNGALELPEANWPATDTGTQMVFQYTRVTQLVECYWFWGYNYYYPQPAIFELRDHPDPVIGGVFADDSIPSLLDPIAGYGSMGFDTDGQVACPEPPVPVRETSWGKIKADYR